MLCDIKSVARYIPVETMSYVPYICINLPINQGSTQTLMHHVIKHTQEAVENRKLYFEHS